MSTLDRAPILGVLTRSLYLSVLRGDVVPSLEAAACSPLTRVCSAPGTQPDDEQPRKNSDTRKLSHQGLVSSRGFRPLHRRSSGTANYDRVLRTGRLRFVVPGEALKPPGLQWHCPRPPGDSAQACSFSSTLPISQPPPSSSPHALAPSSSDLTPFSFSVFFLDYYYYRCYHYHSSSPPSLSSSPLLPTSVLLLLLLLVLVLLRVCYYHRRPWLLLLLPPLSVLQRLLRLLLFQPATSFVHPLNKFYASHDVNLRIPPPSGLSETGYPGWKIADRLPLFLLAFLPPPPDISERICKFAVPRLTRSGLISRSSLVV